VKGRARDIAVVIALAVWAIPVAWQAVTSIRADTDLAGLTAWPTARVTLQHYRTVLTDTPLPAALWNSAVVAALTSALAALLGVPAAYAVARLPVPGRRGLMLLVVMGTAFPTIATVAPLYLLIRAIGLRDTWWALIVADASFALPLTLWLVAGFVRDVPRDIEEAAAVDGADRLRTLAFVVVPAIAPGVAAATLLTFLFTWNEFLFAYTFTATEASRTVPVALALLPGVFEAPWGDIAAASLLASLPPIVIVFALQRHLVRGLLGGSLKE
jgi:multiple sugar transport system permease protein